MRFGDVLEAAAQLSLDEQATLVEILNRRLVEHRRDELALEIRQARQAFEAGKARPGTPEQILKNILS